MLYGARVVRCKLCVGCMLHAGWLPAAEDDAHRRARVEDRRAVAGTASPRHPHARPSTFGVPRGPRRTPTGPPHATCNAVTLHARHGFGYCGTLSAYHCGATGETQCALSCSMDGLQGMRAVKANSWERTMTSQLATIRASELHRLKLFAYFKARHSIRSACRAATRG
jgi:hypothetical protein